MSFGINLGNGMGVGVGEDIPKAGGSGSGPSFIASLLDLLGIHHQVANGGKATPQQSQKAGAKPGKPATTSDAENAIEDGSAGDREEDSPNVRAGVAKMLDMFDSTLGTTQRTGQQNLIPPTPPRVLWGPGMKGFGGGDGSGFSGF